MGLPGLPDSRLVVKSSVHYYDSASTTEKIGLVSQREDCGVYLPDGYHAFSSIMSVLSTKKPGTSNFYTAFGLKRPL